MEKKESTVQQEQLIVLSNKKNLSISGTNKIISLKPELIQLNTVYGNMQIYGNSLELTKLDNNTTRAEISGNIDCIKFVETKQKENLFRKIFK